MTQPRIRCAIYTRKSSEEGLDQDFNSLDVQHEACAAYVASQRHEGWRLLPARYDDGGLSGGTLERPALQRLMTDIGAGRIDMIVVYKIDRLTRSLADFAKLVERLEAAKCSFVSVTQAFNTSSSMGRLTLNVLLSFAQFEREVTAERIRDKIAASKKKGLWMGGVAPIGYASHPDPTRRELVVNEAEANTVRHIFKLYREHRCLNAVAAAAEAEGLRSKRHHFRSGRVQGGTRFSRGQIHKLLTNPVYIGKIRHKDAVYPGLHAAILDQAIWDDVQHLLQEASAKRRGAEAGVVPESVAPLKGKVRDETGDLLTPSHTRRGGKVRRYYVSNRLISGGVDPTGWRLPAKGLEDEITSLVAGHLLDHTQRHDVLTVADAATSTKASKAIEALAQSIKADGAGATAALITSANLQAGQITIDLDLSAIASHAALSPADLTPSLSRLTSAFTAKRRGIETRIIAGARQPAPDNTLVRALRHAHLWADQLKTGTPMVQIAEEAKVSARYVAKLVPLTGLSPRIQSAIIAGSQPIDMTLESLVRRPPPLDWAEQHRRFGIAG
ncbi:recombinase family protein [Gymnodinialimonas ulvae]|uniref:recombinase family protein n=1 Tax=Gymnodinialimonas ulvae TaxID=3126504 RepID=UPI00309B90B0